MKVAAKTVEAYVKKPDVLHRAVLLYGPDSGLVRERAKKIAAAFLDNNTDPFALSELTESRVNEDPALLADELSAISMMCPKRVVMVRISGDKLSRVIEEASSAFNKDVFLIITADELSTRSATRMWFEKSTEAGAIACYRDDVRDVQEVIRKTMETAGVRVDRESVDYLASQLGNDRYVTYQELEKCITFAGESKALSLKDVQSLVDYNREISFDDIVNAVADRNLPQLDKTLTILLREGTSSVAYLRALQRYFNKLYSIRAQMANGASADMVISNLRPPVFFKQVPILTRHVQNWSATSIAKALKLLVNAELACKTSDLPVVPASSRFLLQITQIR